MGTLGQCVITYLLVDLFCIVVGAGIIRKVGSSFGSELEVRYFKHFMGFFLLFCLTDAMVLPLSCGLLPADSLISNILNTANTLTVGLVALWWYLFAMVKMGIHQDRNNELDAAYLIPFAVLVALCVANLFAPVLFGIGEDGLYAPSALYIVSQVLSLGYVLEVAVRGFGMMSKAQTKVQKLEYRAFVSFSVAPIVACVFNAFVPNTPAIAMGVLASALQVFSTLQEARIFNDSLTGLNNRRRADQYLASKISDASKEHAVYLYVLDIDLFKQINDSRGHIEGDRALRVVADGLRRAAGESNGFAARWGGDEFLLVVDGGGNYAPDEIVDVIDRNLSNACDRADLDYDISVSTGYAVCTSPKDEPDQLMMKADQMLYDHKKSSHNRAA